MNASKFWASMDKSGDCWEWTRGKISSGYGKVQFNGKPWLTHRLSWTVANGAIPKGLWVLHTCDNPACCNPGHLFIGNRSDNMKDCASKGRIGVQATPACAARGDKNGSRLHPERLARGEKNNMAKLTAQQVRKIRELEGRLTKKEIASEFGVDVSHVYKIIKRQVWNHV